MPVAYRTQAADDDLRNIAYQIGIESGRPLAADKIVDDLVECCDRLADLSESAQLGTSTPELGRGIRIFSHRRWAIIFRCTDEGVMVLRIADGSQDYLSWKFA